MIDSRAIIRQYVRKIIANVPPDIGEEAAKRIDQQEDELPAHEEALAGRED